VGLDLIYMEKENLLEKQEKENIQTEILQGFDLENLNTIVGLEKKCFPIEWQYPDAEKYYKKILDDLENINIFLKENSEVIGYVLARLHNKEIEDLKNYDPEFKSQENVFYVETIQVLPEKSGKGGAKKLLIAVCEEAKKRGIDKFSIHARTKNRFNDKIKKIFEGHITLIRPIEKWEPANGEPYEYIEWNYKHK
jgi:GNAT superfamily N-acetyltransferase